MKIPRNQTKPENSKTRSISSETVKTVIIFSNFFSLFYSKASNDNCAYLDKVLGMLNGIQDAG